ncbi:MAG: 2-C-methyl-D-erythritol 4-phosphate cytidylyltransferase [Treponema sp.]|nr:2-C-methyl-D-erythritol 4-phosphate cytidylyltransferase [Treponema sp.]
MKGKKKEYCLLDDSITVLGKAVSAFASVPIIKTIVITIPEGDDAAARRALPPELLAAKHPQLLFTAGGSTRQVSVHNALAALSAHNPRYVLIHDGARPWVNPVLIERIIEAVKKYGAVIPLLPLTDTPKECDVPLCETWAESRGSEPPAVFIKQHLKRANTGIAQTPQAFAFPEILHAHEKAAMHSGEDYTDDAGVWGAFYGKVAVVPGCEKNRKITFPGDIERQ